MLRLIIFTKHRCKGYNMIFLVRVKVEISKCCTVGSSTWIIHNRFNKFGWLENWKLGLIHKAIFVLIFVFLPPFLTRGTCFIKTRNKILSIEENSRFCRFRGFHQKFYLKTKTWISFYNVPFIYTPFSNLLCLLHWRKICKCIVFSVK